LEVASVLAEEAWVLLAVAATVMVSREHEEVVEGGDSVVVGG
jgi:hypothetical protein